jgi:hypothetical protein
MLRSGKVTLPVYLDVEPEQLRTPHQGPCPAAFRKHSERGTIEDIKKREKALLDVAHITGHRLDEVNRYKVFLLISLLVDHMALTSILCLTMCSMCAQLVAGMKHSSREEL